MSFLVVIPARFAATRLPGKPLLEIGGKPMIQHVYERACASQAREVVIATDDERIRIAAERFGARVCMTSDAHASGTDRISEVAQLLQLSPTDLVVNVQGDEPLIPPAVIDQVATNLATHPTAGIATLCEPIRQVADVQNPNVVKVVRDAADMALYFSRSPIPHGGDVLQGDFCRHIGIYAYRVATLQAFVGWQRSPLEVRERLEQLRALSHGVRIHVATTDTAMPAGVDTAEDLEAVRVWWARQPRSGA